VPHKNLIAMVRKCSITEILLNEDFLATQETRVRMNNSFSEWLGSLNGVE